MDLRVRALQTILVEKGYVESAALDGIIEAYETKIGPHIGANVIAKAWRDPAFKAALLADATKAIGAFGSVGDHLIAVENTPQLHNMVVCTLCSCYPWDVLGLPPVWYKSFAYRSRAVKEPRGCSRISASPCRQTPRSGSGIPPLRRDFWSCRCGRPAPRAGAKSNSPIWSLGTSMIGTGLPKMPSEVS